MLKILERSNLRERERETETERERERQRDREAEGERERVRDRDREKDRASRGFVVSGRAPRDLDHSNAKDIGKK